MRKGLRDNGAIPRVRKMDGSDVKLPVHYKAQDVLPGEKGVDTLKRRMYGAKIKIGGKEKTYPANPGIDTIAQEKHFRKVPEHHFAKKSSDKFFERKRRGNPIEINTMYNADPKDLEDYFNSHKAPHAREIVKQKKGIHGVLKSSKIETTPRGETYSPPRKRSIYLEGNPKTGSLNHHPRQPQYNYEYDDGDY